MKRWRGVRATVQVVNRSKVRVVKMLTVSHGWLMSVSLCVCLSVCLSVSVW